MASFGNFIKLEREKKSWSQTDFGALVKINTTAISKIENDKKSISSSKLKLLSELFEIDYDKIKDMYFGDKFAKEAFKNQCSESVFNVASEQIKYLKSKNIKQGEIKF